MLGALIASGHDLDDLLDRYSWESIALQSRCVMRHKVGLINLVAEPILSVLGAGYSGSKVADNDRPTRRRRRRGPNDKSFSLEEAKEQNPERAEMGLLHAFHRAGIAVTQRKAGGADPAG
ncbi:MAG: hypothetical protein HRU00_16980 [Myxococcales bacterium]|nr:hypothetical protein [Myxococcales bacterium]